MADPAREDPRLASIELQQLWFQLQRRQWASLVVIPADPGSSGAGVATSLWKVGTLIGNPAPKVLNAERMGPGVIAELIRDLANAKEAVTAGLDQPRILVSIESVLSNPLGIGIAQAADALLLCVRKGRTKIAAARRTIELIGRERFLGSVVLNKTR
jgi:hypothetical protein